MHSDHLTSHNQKRQFVCVRCGVRYKYKRDLEKHCKKKCKGNNQSAQSAVPPATLPRPQIPQGSPSNPPAPPHPPHRAPNNIDSQLQTTLQSAIPPPVIPNANGHSIATEYPPPLLFSQRQPRHGDPVAGAGTPAAPQSWHSQLDLGAGGRRVRDSRAGQIEKTILDAIQASRQIVHECEQEWEYYRRQDACRTPGGKSWVEDLNTGGPEMATLGFGRGASTYAAQPIPLAWAPTQRPQNSSIPQNPQPPPHCQSSGSYSHRIPKNVDPQSRQSSQSEFPSSSNTHGARSASAPDESPTYFRPSPQSRFDLGEGAPQASNINSHLPYQSAVLVATQVQHHLHMGSDSVIRRGSDSWRNFQDPTLLQPSRLNSPKKRNPDERAPRSATLDIPDEYVTQWEHSFWPEVPEEILGGDSGFGSSDYSSTPDSAKNGDPFAEGKGT